MIDMKKIKNMKYRFTPAAILFILFAGAAGAFAMPHVTGRMDICPHTIHIDKSYNGTDLTITGEIPADTQAVIRLTGDGESIPLKKKGKAMGLIWMNMDTVTFENCPPVFIEDIPEALSAEASADIKKWKALGIGLDALEHQIIIRPKQTNKADLFNEFVKLKQKEGKYQSVYNAIEYKNTNGIAKAFSARMTLPARLKPGRYKVELFEIKNDTIVGEMVQSLEAGQVGLPKALSNMAFKHSLAYGVMSVFIAIFAGLITGFIFKGGKGAH